MSPVISVALPIISISIVSIGVSGHIGHYLPRLSISQGESLRAEGPSSAYAD